MSLDKSACGLGFPLGPAVGFPLPTKCAQKAEAAEEAEAEEAQEEKEEKEEKEEEAAK